MKLFKSILHALLTAAVVAVFLIGICAAACICIASIWFVGILTGDPVLDSHCPDRLCRHCDRLYSGGGEACRDVSTTTRLRMSSKPRRYQNRGSPDGSRAISVPGINSTVRT